MTSHIGQYLVVMAATAGYTGQYGPQHDLTLRKWHSWRDIQIIGYQGYKTEQAQSTQNHVVKDYWGTTTKHVFNRIIFLPVVLTTGIGNLRLKEKCYLNQKYEIWGFGDLELQIALSENVSSSTSNHRVICS